MEFIFVCPEQNKVFKSTDFGIIDNKGVTTDTWGNRVLDARVELREACPFCGKMHTYHASELVCPFESPETGTPGKKGDGKE